MAGSVLTRGDADAGKSVCAFEFSEDQTRAIETISNWVRTGSEQTLTLGGYAGTGKTTVIKELVRITPGAVRVCAPTGKAAHVLRTKGVEATTIHSLIYRFAVGCSKCRTAWYQAHSAHGKPSRMFLLRHSLACKLIIVDEASMIDGQVMWDLESLCTKVLYVGDHGQLQPVRDDPGLMSDPQVRLEQIHRQAEKSGIISMAHHLRTGGNPAAFGHDAALCVGSPPDLPQYDMVLCGYNRTRVEVNRRIRRALGFSGDIPEVGERVVCLRNDTDYALFNGMLATVVWVARNRQGQLTLDLHDDDQTSYDSVPVAPAQFLNPRTLTKTDRDLTLWDFGYALTVHKAQGSEWKSVAVLEQIGPSWDAGRWRYTAATRASERLTYCVSAKGRSV